MASVCAVRFTRYGRLYYLDPGPFRPRVGDKVLVPTDDGPEVAECVWAPEPAEADVGALPRMVGLATAADLARDERNRRRRQDAGRTVRDLVRSAALPMKVVGIDYVDSGDRPRYTVYFSAPVRVDFRSLLRDLCRALSARVELRQLGDRDEAKVQGGIGPCGRDLCCATFLPDFEPVTLRMAKDQLALNPMRISGSCGRLLCCLRYEHPLYQDFRASAPPVGAVVDTPDGAATVVGHAVPAGAVELRLDSGRRWSCPLADVCDFPRLRAGRTTAAPRAAAVESAP